MTTQGPNTQSATEMHKQVHLIGPLAMSYICRRLSMGRISAAKQPWTSFGGGQACSNDVGGVGEGGWSVRALRVGGLHKRTRVVIHAGRIWGTWQQHWACQTKRSCLGMSNA